MQRQELRTNGPGIYGEGGAAPSFSGCNKRHGSSFFDGLRLEYISIAEAILRSSIINSLQSMNIMKLSTEILLQLDWGLVWLPKLPPPPTLVWLGGSKVGGFVALMRESFLALRYRPRFHLAALGVKASKNKMIKWIRFG